MSIEQWFANGTTYNVNAAGKDKFLKDFPDAINKNDIEKWKFEDKIYNVSPKGKEKFLIDFPNATLIETNQSQDIKQKDKDLKVDTEPKSMGNSLKLSKAGLDEIKKYQQLYNKTNKDKKESRFTEYLINGELVRIEVQDLEDFENKFPNVKPLTLDERLIRIQNDENIGEEERALQITNAYAAPVQLGEMKDWRERFMHIKNNPELYHDKAGFVEKAASFVPDWVVGWSTQLANRATDLFIEGPIKAAESEKLAKGIQEGKTREEMMASGELTDLRAFDIVQNELNKFARREYDEEGNELNVIDLIEKGEYSRAGGLASEQAFSNIYSVVLAGANPYAAGVALGAGVYGDEYTRAVTERFKPEELTEEVMNDIRLNSAIKSGGEFVGEVIGGKFLRAASGLRKSGAPVKVVEEFNRGFINRGIRGFIGGFAGEAVAEGITNNIQQAADELIYGDEKTSRDYIRGALNDGLIGGLMGGPISGITRAANKIDREQLQYVLASNKWRSEVSELNQKIEESERDLENAPDKSKPFIQKRIDILKKKRDAKKRELNSIFKNKTQAELLDYANTLDEINNQTDIAFADNVSDDTREDARNAIKQLNAKLNQDTDGWIDENFEEYVGNILKSREILDKRGMTWGFGRDSKLKSFDTTEKYLKKIKEETGIDATGAEGMFYDGKTKTIYIDKQRAAEVGALNVYAHEILHYVMSRNFKTDNESMKPMVDALKEYLVTSGNERVIDRIEMRMLLNGDMDINGEFKEGKLEEYFEILSDLMDTRTHGNYVKLDKNKTGSLIKPFKDFIVGLGFTKVNLKDGEAIFDFIKTYNKNINRSGLLGQITKRGITRVKLEADIKGVKKADSKSKTEPTAKESKTPLQAINDLVPSNVKTQADYYKLLDNPKVTKRIFDGRRLSPVIENYIRSKSTSLEEAAKNLENVRDRLVNFDPESKRKDGSTIGPKGFGEFIFANVKFGKLDAKKDLFEEGQIRGKTDRIDQQQEGKRKRDIVDTSETVVDEETGDRYSKLRRDLGLNDDMVSKVRQAIIKTFGTKLPNVESKDFKAELQKRFRTELKKPIQDMIGTKENYTNFLVENFESVFNILPVETLVQMERRVDNDNRIFIKEIEKNISPTRVDELVDEGLLPKDVGRTTGPSLWEKQAYPGVDKVLAFFRGIDMQNQLNYKVGGSTLGTRKDKLAMEIGVELAFDATSETIQDPDIQEKRRGILSLQGQEQANNELAVVAKQINRDPSVKFSMSVERTDAFQSIQEAAEFYQDGRDLVNAIAAKGDLGGIVNIKKLKEGKYVGIGEYKNIPANTIKYIIDEIYLKDKLFLNTGKLLNKIAKGIKKGDPRSKGFEQYIINQFKKIDGVELIFEYQSEEGIDIPDVYGTLYGQPFNVEVKLFDAQISSLTINDINVKTGKVIIKKIDNISKDNKKIVNKLVSKTIPVLKEIKGRLSNLASDPRANSKDKKLLKEWNSPKDLMPDWAHKTLLKEGYFKKLTQKGYFDQSLIEELYLNKAVPTNYIYMLGKGFFHIGKDVIGLNSTKLEGTFMAPIRQVKASQKQTTKGVTSKTGYVNLNMRLIPTIAEITSKSNMDIIDDADIKNFIPSKFSKSLLETKQKVKNVFNLKKAHDNRIKYSKSGESRGMSTFDFDDTLARTKSGVRYTMPNPEGTPAPKRKVIFLAGGAGSGKSNVVKQLGLEKQGFKVVNQDISLEWLTKNSGLPTDMRDFTPEQASKWGSLQWQARGIAQRKQMKFQGRGDGIIVDGTGASKVSMGTQVMKFRNAGYDVQMIFVETSLDVALERNRARKERSLKDFIVERNWKQVQANKKAFKEDFGGNFAEVNTDNLKQGDAMPTDLINKIDNFISGYIKSRLTAEEFASQGDALLNQGAEFDFSEFNKVVDGTPGPLLEKARKRAEKYGTKDMFVLTARPQGSAFAIQQFLKGQGLDIPIGNITGLANSTGEAKANWMLEKFAEGYNDMYFVDDALQNVKAVKDVLDQLDIKSEVVQAKIKFSKSAPLEFNKILEQTKKVAAGKVFSAAEARKIGVGKGKNIFKNFFVPPSAEDFKGLLYAFIGKGEQGNAHAAFFKENLLDPFAKGIRDWNTYKQAMSNDYKALKKQFKGVGKRLNNKVKGTPFTNDNAIRVYLWNKAGFEIPGLSDSQIEKLVDHVENNSELKQFAEGLGVISRTPEGYIEPNEFWVVESIASDLTNIVRDNGRKDFLAEWINNKDIIFSPDNLNKIEAIYGTGFRSELEKILYRMETGRNRLTGKDAQVNMLLDWINGSVGAVMFFNMRSATLQTISMANFINMSDNNPVAAAAALANAPQFIKDFAYIFNSDMLKQRRAGLQIDVSASELTRAFVDGKSKPQAIIHWLLEKGFTPTQIADSFAIAAGGAPFYRNRLKAYAKQGMSEAKAKEQAWLDFQEVAEETQQSSRPDLISNQQAGPLGRLILAWQNTPMQMTRLMKKKLSDFVNRRRIPGYTQFQSDMANISGIAYYGLIQNIYFGALQTGLMFMLFGWDEDEERKEKLEKRVANGALDSILRGTGIYGAGISTLKNVLLKWKEEADKPGWKRENMNIAQEAVNLSPPMGTKMRKIMQAVRTEEWNKGVSKEIGWRIENPNLSITANWVEALTNLPIARMIDKANNIEEALTGNHQIWQKVALISGWSKWSLGVEDEELEKAKATVEEKRKKEKEIKKQKDKEKKKKNRVRCIATKTSGGRCKNTTTNKNKRCYAHQ